MNNDINRILYHRAKIIQNLDHIISSSKRNNIGNGQLSLFEDDIIDVAISMEEPENFDPMRMISAEREVLGFNILYSQFDDYFAVQCRYCNSTILSLMDETIESKTLLASIKSIEYKISQYGNKYAKIIFSDSTGDERMYLFGKLYEKMIGRCFIDKIYLLTVKQSSIDKNKLDIVNFMLADEITDVSKSTKTIRISTQAIKLPELRIYIHSHMRGNSQNVEVFVEELNLSYKLSTKIQIDNDNLLEMSKKGFKILLK